MKKILFGVAALGLLGLAGAGLGLKAQDTVEAKAESYSDYYLAGYFNGDKVFNNTYQQMLLPSTGTDRAYITYSFKVGDAFQIQGEDNWYKQGNVAGGDAAGAFKISGDNIECILAGEYTIYLSADSVKPIWITFSTPAESYSYVATNFRNGNLDRIYRYKAGGSSAAWGNDLWGSGRIAYNPAKFNNLENYAITRIDDRLLNGWTTFILYNGNSGDNNQSGDISIAGTGKMYVDNTPYGSESDMYKAAEFAWNLANERGQAISNSDGLTYQYSFCAAPKSYVTTYDSLGDGIKAILANTAFKTYDVTTPILDGDERELSQTATITIPQIIEALRNMPSGGSSVNKFASFAEDGNFVGNITIIVTVAALVGIGAFFIARKRRAE